MIGQKLQPFFHKIVAVANALLLTCLFLLFIGNHGDRIYIDIEFIDIELYQK